jgi:hypothetical protein
LYRARLAITISFAASASACTGGAGGDQHLDIVFDVCAPIAITAPGATPDEAASIDAAVALWRTRGVTLAGFTTAPGDVPAIEIRFAEAAAAFHGVYEDEIGVIFVNAGLDDDEARTITIAHELGHAFGLWHVASGERSSVMNPGNLTTVPNAGDGLALETLWGLCAGPGPVGAPGLLADDAE